MALKLSVASTALPRNGTLVLLTNDKLTSGKAGQALEKKTRGLIKKCAAVAHFKGKRGSCFEILRPQGLGYDRLVIAGIGKITDARTEDWIKMGGTIASTLADLNVSEAALMAEGLHSEDVASMALGATLASYKFDRYKTKKKDGDKKSLKRLAFLADDPAELKDMLANVHAVAEGVHLARDLVNMPPNDLGPLEFAEQCKTLVALGINVKVLTEKDMKALGMGALLGVGQGSASTRASRLVVMEWKGAKAPQPVAVVGKGVVFDTGGISIKPAASMEDMKGDMGGAACVTGLMHTLARRKARSHVVGVVGLVENMPDGNAQRPGDIVTSMSGQTIEIINTDAEGRLVLADALWYAQETYKPAIMINLATLTGAIMVALGQEHAGLFSNNDQLSEHLTAAGLETGEKVWRMPLNDAYDKLMDSKFADMKNAGGRDAGSITAAQFLQRFVNKVPWAHLDIAGTAFGTKASDINKSWGTGFGVRLLDHLIANYYDSASN